MADQTNKITTSSQITHVGSGAQITSGGFSTSTDVSTTLSGTGNLAKYSRADLVLTVAPTATTSSTSMQIACYRRDMNVEGTNDAGAPSSIRRVGYVGTFVVEGTAASTTSRMILVDVPLAGYDCEFYVENLLSGNIPAGWTLHVTPKSDVGATS